MMNLIFSHFRAAQMLKAFLVQGKLFLKVLAWVHRFVRLANRMWSVSANKRLLRVEQ